MDSDSRALILESLSQAARYSDQPSLAKTKPRIARMTNKVRIAAFDGKVAAQILNVNSRICRLAASPGVAPGFPESESGAMLLRHEASHLRFTNDDLRVPRRLVACLVNRKSNIVNSEKVGCRGWNRTSIRAVKGRCPTVRRPGSIKDEGGGWKMENGNHIFTILYFLSSILALKEWWPARVARPVQQIKSLLHHFNACRPAYLYGARGRACTGTGDVLDIVPLPWATRARTLR